MLLPPSPQTMFGCETFLRREDEVVPSKQSEIDNGNGKPDRDPKNTLSINRIEQLIKEGDDGNRNRGNSARNTKRTDEWPLDVRLIDSKQDECDCLQNIREHRPKDRHVEERAAYDDTTRLGSFGEPENQHNRQRDSRTSQHGQMRCFVDTMGYRQKRRKIACPGQ